MAYKLIYNPLIDYIRSHVRLCAGMLYSKASMQLGGILWHASQNLYVYGLMMESK